MTIQLIRPCLAILLVMVGSPALATGHIVDIAWGPHGRFAHKTPIAAGKFFEVCGKLGPGVSVRWSFTSSAPVDFNIHHHLGRDVVFAAKQAQVNGGGDTLSVKQEQDYCWMWMNKGREPVSLSVELTR